MTLTSKHLILLTGATFLLVNLNVKATTTSAPQTQTQKEQSKSINKSTKRKVVPPITSPEQQLKIKENDVLDELPG